MSQSIQPLRIQKTTALSSPNKMNGTPIHQPLAELGPSERRRNSPSFNQVSKKSLFQTDSSPFDSSPVNSASPRLYWQSRDPGSPTRNNVENRDPRDHSPSPAKRSSIENLMRASRVKNSNMFAREQKQEYDPTSSPMIERPLATGRPLSTQAQGNAFSARVNEGLQSEGKMGYGKNAISLTSSQAGRASMPNPATFPNKGQHSPTKSSLSSKGRYVQGQPFDPETGIWSDEEESFTERQLPPGKSLHRHAKSVTFDVAPPQVNEYEMTTPDPSSVASGSRDGSHDSTEDEDDESFDHGSSFDRDDSFDASLEDTEKTPVVLPEDWRFMSPGAVDDELTTRVEDPFEGARSSPASTTRPTSAVDARLSPTRTDSTNSNGERRPLPPLPPSGVLNASHNRSDSKSSLSATAERIDHSHRSAASPPRPASVTKSEIQGMGGCSVSLENRLKLMMLEDDSNVKSTAEEQRERRLRRGSPVRSPDPSESHDEPVDQAEGEEDDLADFADYKAPPRISRESILRKVKDRSRSSEQVDERDGPSFVLSARFSQDITNIDPDIPLPSTEVADDQEPMIKREPDEESEVDVYAIPDLYGQHLEAESFMNAMEKLETIKQSQATDIAKDDDDESHYSVDSKTGGLREGQQGSTDDDEGPPTPRVHVPVDEKVQTDMKASRRMSLPQFAALLGEQDFDFGMDSFMTEMQPAQNEPVKSEAVPKPSWTPSPPFDIQETKTFFANQTELQRPITPEAQLLPPRFPDQRRSSVDEPRTPDSVIRHPVAESPAPDSPGIPEPVATIKAPGTMLKTRQSATPADIQTMAEVRRQVSGEIPPVPKIPERVQSRPSIVAETAEGSYVDRADDAASMQSNGSAGIPKQTKRKSSLVTLDIPMEETDEGLGIENEFDRLLEAQKVQYYLLDANPAPVSQSPGSAEGMPGQGFQSFKHDNANHFSRKQKGYLMRQNTKVIIASSASHESNPDVMDGEQHGTRGTRSAGNSPRKASQTQTWTTEPWNGKVRRKSIRKSGGLPSKPASGPVPPLPGQQSNVASGLDSVAEDETMARTEEIGDDGERGRLFVKVVRVKDLGLPLPKGERSYFALTLDNGLHCVTTSWLELGKTAPIGQEFELVVLDDLEFQLTLQTRLEEPVAKPGPESPTKSAKATKPSTFSRVFASPRKRKEMELKQQQDVQRAERQRQQDAQASRRSIQPTAWDLLHSLVAKDGSFARSYICLKDHESSAFGKPYVVDVPCFNEWAAEEDSNGSSARSKRTGGVQRRAPYRVGKLELQLLYVPKPKGAKDGDMPKSMNACIRELKEAERAGPKKWEGHLSQQGGDCPYWRRRFFSLDGSKFTAYHEATRQPRATINLAKASKLIDDKSALMKPGKGGRRKSAFAEEEEGYMFVEEGFRMRFANGETIDFYADSAVEKDGWMKALSEVVGKDTKNKTWTDLVLARHRAAASRAQQTADGKIQTSSQSRTAPSSPTKAGQAARSAPPTPAKTFVPRQPVLPVPERNPRRSDVNVASRRSDAAAKTRSMIF